MFKKLTETLKSGVKKIDKYFGGKTDKRKAFNRAIMATAMGLFMSVFLIQPLSISTSTLFSSPDKTDFQLPDLYAQIADNRPIRQLEDRMVIVNIGRSNREEIAEAMSVLSLCGPKAVGLDVIFAEQGDNDAILIEALKSVPGLVLPLGLEGNKKDGVFEIDEKPFFYDDYPEFKYGVVNLPVASARGTIREYAVDFPTNEGVIPSFVEALAEIASPEMAEKLRIRGSETGITSYHSREYDIINIEEIEDYAEKLAGKIVLVGTIEDSYDMHNTTVRSHVAGIMLHAAALSTILDGIWFYKIPKYIDFLIALILCFLICLIVYGYNSKLKGIILRLIQFFLVYFAVRIGYSLYKDHNVIFDISYTVTIILLGLFAVDIWNGIEGLWAKLIKRIENSDKTIKKQGTWQSTISRFFSSFFARQ